MYQCTVPSRVQLAYQECHGDAGAAKVTCRPSRRHEWISNDTRQLVEDKRAALLAGNLTEYRELNKRCQKSARLDKQRWADEKALAGEAALSRGSAQDAFAHFRQLRSACPHISSPILNANGSLISDKVQKAARWHEYYEQLLTRPTHLPTELAQSAASTPEDTTIDCDPPTDAEVARAIGRLKSGKAPGICGIPAELLKAGGYRTVQWLTKIFQSVWQTEQMPLDWKKGIILPLYKGKGSRRQCKNYRGITLLSTPGKVFALTLLAWIKTKLLEVRCPEQSGFTPRRPTVDRIVTLNTLLQTSHCGLHMLT